MKNNFLKMIFAKKPQIKPLELLNHKISRIDSDHDHIKLTLNGISKQLSQIEAKLNKRD